MRGTIVDILPMKPGRVYSVPYSRVAVVLESGEWTKIDLVPSFRNYEAWGKVLELGNIIEGLTFKNREERTLDADFPPTFVGKQSVWQAIHRHEGEQLELL